MENLSALEPRHTVLCPEHMLFDMQNGTWFVETIRASGQVRRANRPDTRPHLTNINHIRNVLLSRRALLHKSGSGRSSPFPRTDLFHDVCDGYAERGEAVENGDANLELRNLTVEVPSGQTLKRPDVDPAVSHNASTDRQGHVKHDPERFGFDAASAVIAAPSSPDCSTEAFRGTKRLVARDRPGAIGLP